MNVTVSTNSNWGKEKNGNHTGPNRSTRSSHSLEDKIVTSTVTWVCTVNSFNSCSIKEPVSNRHCNCLHNENEIQTNAKDILIEPLTHSGRQKSICYFVFKP